MTVMEDCVAKAKELGSEAARNAATWAVDGNTSQGHIQRVLKMFDDGDPAVDDYLPARPDLSGEWADSPTPNSIVEEVTSSTGSVVNEAGREAIIDAWEEGVSETFAEACEAEFRKWAA